MGNKKSYFSQLYKKLFGYLKSPGFAGATGDAAGTDYFDLDTTTGVKGITFLFRSLNNSTTTYLLDLRNTTTGFFYASGWEQITGCNVNEIAVTAQEFFAAVDTGVNDGATWHRVYVAFTGAPAKIRFYTRYTIDGSYVCDMKDLRVFNAHLTAEQQAAAHNGNPDDTKLMAYFPFAENLEDSTGKGVGTVTTYKNVKVV